MKKKLAAIMASAVMLAGAAFGLTACGGESSPEGEWEFSSLLYTGSGLRIELREGQQILGFATVEPEAFTLTIKEDNTGTYRLMGGERSELKLVAGTEQSPGDYVISLAGSESSAGSTTFDVIVEGNTMKLFRDLRTYDYEIEDGAVVADEERTGTYFEIVLKRV